ncbi:Predicted DNA-binding transcriptional regulator YafY, contains an HTH and WYL domains [Anaerobranca californiensis DSM 14826]|uniref:Predicted DNA-binding transcriptional regulator YafY, contains an HTH and WYL domains n=1 Tax=Anaerobranca californiensis DSM 14826 TaxID=1120989 RepID=A0A1M6QKC1_9FIRM|nr:WYL domain-containing protein [Anaerobranca californiensis]SHK20692.1 Predicted DNA-binding transcriptional regulator YafY, contains an HTH and WYL domains [Anaerobranca californiensis DSM 14826]
MRTFNQGVEKYNKLRFFLANLYLYGCYSRDDFAKLGVSLRFYDEELRRVKNLKEFTQFLEEERINLKKVVKLKYDYYETAENYLINSYLNSNIRERDLLLFLSIIKVLSDEDELTVEEVIEKTEENFQKVEEKLGYLDRDIDYFFDKMTYYRKLEYLLNLGILEYSYQGNKKLYKLQKNFFEGFTNNELKEIYYLTTFFSHIEKPSVPGSYLKENIKRYLCLKKVNFKYLEPFLYRFLQFHQVLDEELVWSLLEAINESKKVKIYYHTQKGCVKEFKNLPVKIILDVKFGRWYLIASNLKGDCFYTYPLQRIKEIKVMGESIKLNKGDLNERYEKYFANCWLVGGNKSTFKEVRIKFTLDDDITENFLLEMVKRDIVNPQIELINEKEFILTVYLSDVKEIKPWIKGFSYRCEVLPSTEHSLREELQRDWEEVLSLYESL